MAQLKDSVVSGNLRVTDTTFTDTLQVTTIKAPSTSGGTTYSAGTNGQVLKSNGTSTYWGTDSAGTDEKVKQEADTGTNFRPLVLGKTSSTDPASLGATVTDQTYVSTHVFVQPSTGNLTLWSASGDSPALIFRRGTLIDNNLDWKIYDTGGLLQFDRNKNGSTESWENIFKLDPSNNKAYLKTYEFLTTNNTTTASIGSASAGTAIPADDITAWSEGTLPSLTTETHTIPNVTGNTEVTIPNVTGNTNVTIPNVTAATDVSVPNITANTSVTLHPISSATDVSIPNVTGNTNVSIPNVTGATDVSVPNITANTSVTIPNVSATESVTIPNVTGNTSVTIPNVTAATDVSVPNITGNTSVTAKSVKTINTVMLSATISEGVLSFSTGASVVTEDKTATNTTLGTANTASKVTLGTALSASKVTLGTALTATKVTMGDNLTATNTTIGTAKTASKVTLGTALSASKVTLGTALSASKVTLGDDVTVTNTTLGDANTASKVTLGTALSASKVTLGTALKASKVTLGDSISVDDVKTWSAGTLPSLSYTAKSIPNISVTSVTNVLKKT